MNVPTITMPIEEARAAFREYRDTVRTRQEQDGDAAIMIGYGALARGRAIVDIFEAIPTAGLHDNGLPKLAIGRADWPYVQLAWRWKHPGHWTFAKWPSPRRGRPPAGINLPAGLLPRSSVNFTPRAMTPLIPPRIRPATAELHRYHILWEADWQAPPGDPMLLRHLAGSLYAVLAVWDLSPLERAVLGATRRAALP